MLQNDLFEVLLVDGVEGVKVGAVDVQHGDDLAVLSYGYDDLALGGGGAGDVSREFMDVGHDDRLVLRPRRAADAFVVRDACAGDGSLERTEDQLAGHW